MGACVQATMGMSFLEGLLSLIEGLQGVIAVRVGLQKVREFAGGFVEGL